MRPVINGTSFGSITINGEINRNDVVIGLNGLVRKRQKKLSKEVFGSSHTVSIQEAQNIFEEGSEELIIGTGQTGYVRLSPEAKSFFVSKHCKVQMYPTPMAIKAWNREQGAVIGLFHVTC